MSEKLVLALAIKTLADEVYVRAAYEGLRRVGKDPSNMGEVDEFVRSLDPLRKAFMDHIATKLSETLADETECTTESLITWHTGVQVHGSLDEAAKHMQLED